MDPIAESQWLYRLQGMDVPAEVPVDSSLRQLRESRLRMDSLFNIQSAETRSFLLCEADRIASALREGKAQIRFQLPETVVLPGDGRAADVPMEFREQRIGGFLNRFPVKDIRAAFRSRLSQLENSGYFGVQTGAGLLRFAVARRLVLDLRPEESMTGLPEGITDPGPDFLSPRDGEGLRSYAAPEDPGETELLKKAEGAILRLRRAINNLHQAVSLAPYMYADEEFQTKRAVLLARLISLGHAYAHREVRGIVRTIWRRALENDLNRGLWLSVPYFDDRALELKDYEFEVIPPGRTMFVPAFVALAASREQERVEQQDSLSPSTRIHLLAELKSLEQAFDSRPR